MRHPLRTLALGVAAATGLLVPSARTVGAQDSDPREANRSLCEAVVALTDAAQTSPGTPAEMEARLDSVASLIADARALATPDVTPILDGWEEGTASVRSLLEPIGFDVGLLAGDQITAIVDGVAERLTATTAWADGACPYGVGTTEQITASVVPVCTVTDGATALSGWQLALSNGGPTQWPVTVNGSPVDLSPGFVVVPVDSPAPEVTVGGSPLDASVGDTEDPCAVANTITAAAAFCPEGGSTPTEPFTLTVTSFLDVPVTASVVGYGDIEVPAMGDAAPGTPPPATGSTEPGAAGSGGSVGADGETVTTVVGDTTDTTEVTEVTDVTDSSGVGLPGYVTVTLPPDAYPVQLTLLGETVSVTDTCAELAFTDGPGTTAPTTTTPTTSPPATPQPLRPRFTG